MLELHGGTCGIFGFALGWQYGYDLREPPPVKQFTSASEASTLAVFDVRGLIDFSIGLAVLLHTSAVCRQLIDWFGFT